MNKRESKDPKYLQILKKILENKYFQIFINVLTIYALWGDDIRILAFDQEADIAFDILTIICLVLFSIEIFLSVLCKPKYFNSFFFWLDVLSTITLVFDLTWVADTLFASS